MANICQITKKLQVVVIAQIRYTFNVHTGIRLDVRCSHNELGPLTVYKDGRHDCPHKVKP